jgi:hypothetical protein
MGLEEAVRKTENTHSPNMPMGSGDKPTDVVIDYGMYASSDAAPPAPPAPHVGLTAVGLTAALGLITVGLSATMGIPSTITGVLGLHLVVSTYGTHLKYAS